MSRPGNAGQRRWLRRAFLLALGVLLFFSLVPTWRYKPFCKGPPGYYMEGPLRTVFVDQVEDAMDDAGMVFVRIGDRIYQPYLPLFDGWVSVDLPGRPWDRYDIRRNVEWRLVHNVAFGWGPRIDGSRDRERIEPPPALLEALARSEAEYGPFPRPDSAVESSARYRSCDVKRAAAIKVEELGE